MAHHSIRIDDEVSNSAKAAMKPESRDFSNLCEVSLREYLEARGYLTPTKDDESRQILCTLSVAMDKAPKIKAELRKLCAKAVRAKYVEAAAAGAK